MIVFFVFFLSFASGRWRQCIKIQTKRNTELRSQLRPHHCTNFTMTYGDKLVSHQYSFLKTACADYTLHSRGKWIFLMINWLFCSPSTFLLSPCVCVYDNFRQFFHFYASQGPHSTVYSNEPINYFWLHDPIVDLVVAPNRARLCLKWKWHRGRCWSTLNRYGRIF